MMERTIQAWDEAARSDRRRAHIHPSGVKGDDAYERSGLDEFYRLAEIIGWEHDRRVIDFGCGDGRVTIPLACHYHDVLAVDASLSMLIRLNQRAHIPAMVSDGINLASKLDAPVDAVVALAVLIHHTHSDTARLIAELARCLKSGGKLIASLPIYEQSKEPEAWSDIAVWTLPELADAARGAGLTVEQATVNPGAFSWDAIGLNHHALTVLAKP